MTDPFVLLGVPEDADDGTVKKCYLKKVRAYPPEQHPKKFQEIRAAFEAIRGERERVAYHLFHLPQPDLERRLSATLTTGPSQRPSEKKILEWLTESFKAYRPPREGDVL